MKQSDRRPGADAEVRGDAEPQRGLPHRRPCGEDDEVAGLEAGGQPVEVAEPAGDPGHVDPGLVELRDPLEALGEERPDLVEVARDPLLGEVEDDLLGAVDEHRRLPEPLAPEAHDLLAGLDQAAEGRRLLDDPRVVLDVRGRRDERRELGDPGGAPDLLELAALLELVRQGDRVDRLALPPEAEARPVDRAVRAAVVVGRVDDLGDRADRALREQHRPEDGLLRLDVLRRHRGGRECVRRAHGAAFKSERRTGHDSGRRVGPASGRIPACPARIEHTFVCVNRRGRRRRPVVPRLPAGVHRKRHVFPTDNPAPCVEFVRSSTRLYASCGRAEEKRGGRRPPPLVQAAGSSSASGAASSGSAGSCSAGASASAAASAASSASSLELLLGERLLGRAHRLGVGALGGLGLGPLGGLDGGQLLLGRQVAAFGHDEGLHLGGDPLEHVHRDAEAADPLDHVEVDLAAVDADLARPPDLLGDVGRRDGAEERTCRAGLDLEPQDGLRQRRRDLGGLLGRGGLVPGALLFDPADLGDAPGGRDLGELPGEQVVARVAALHVDDVALQAELLDVAAQDDLHHAPCTYGRSAISRARLTATATWRWCRRHAPVMRRLRILPFSEM